MCKDADDQSEQVMCDISFKACALVEGHEYSISDVYSPCFRAAFRRADVSYIASLESRVSLPICFVAFNLPVPELSCGFVGVVPVHSAYVCP